MGSELTGGMQAPMKGDFPDIRKSSSPPGAIFQITGWPIQLLRCSRAIFGFMLELLPRVKKLFAYLCHATVRDVEFFSYVARPMAQCQRFGDAAFPSRQLGQKIAEIDAETDDVRHGSGTSILDNCLAPRIFDLIETIEPFNGDMLEPLAVRGHNILTTQSRAYLAAIPHLCHRVIGQRTGISEVELVQFSQAGHGTTRVANGFLNAFFTKFGRKMPKAEACMTLDCREHG